MKFSRMLVISRPIYWIGTVGMYMVGIGKLTNFSWLGALELLFFTFPLNFYLYGLNDLYDGRSDLHNERKGGMQGSILKKIEKKELKRMLWFFPVLFVFLSFFSRRIEHIILGMLFIFLGFAYSHPYFRWKEIPLVDCLVSAVGYSCPALIAFSLHDSVISISPKYFLFVLPFMGAHALSTLVDDKYDKKAKMGSSGLYLGKKGTFVFLIISFFIPVLFFWKNPVLSAVSLTVIGWSLTLLGLNEKDYRKALFPAAVTIVTLEMVVIYYFFLAANL